MQRTIENRAEIRDVTLGEVQLNDGQRMLAFNDFFIGCAGHASARYTLRFAGRAEPQSSSGVIVSTGAGSTGWFSSMFNMVEGFSRWMGEGEQPRMQLSWDDPRLLWAVREPFKSKHSSTELVAGVLDREKELVLESLMPSRGIIFSDGVESDFLEFNTGTIARISQAQQRAHLVTA